MLTSKIKIKSYFKNANFPSMHTSCSFLDKWYQCVSDEFLLKNLKSHLFAPWR